MATLETKDGTRIHYKDWGAGPPVVFSHGWPLTGDAWEGQMLSLSANGFRTIAHDRRGHGRSSQPSDGNDMDHYADDLDALLQRLDLQNAILIGHSTGGGEVARYVGRHGTKRLAAVVLVSAVPPLLLRTAANPGGLPLAVFDDIRKGVGEDRSAFYRELATPFFGWNRPGAKVSEPTRDFFWLQSMMGGLKGQYECIKAFSETDFRADLAKLDVPTLLIHGDDDQIVPFAMSSPLSAKLIKGSRLQVYQGAPHGLAQTHKQRLDEDLLAFVSANAAAPPVRRSA